MRLLSKILSLIFIIFIAYLVLFVRPYSISGDSMQPYLNQGDIIIIDTMMSKIVAIPRHAIIVYSDQQSQEKIKIKRIVGLPRETVKIYDGKIAINGDQELEEKYLGEHVRTCMPGSCIDLSESMYEIPENKYFVLGDYRENSVDSRGCTEPNRCDRNGVKYIPKEEIIGQMIFKF